MIGISGGLRGAGDTRTVMVITMLRLWVIFVPFFLPAIIWLEYGVSGLWIAEIISFLVFNAIILKRFNSHKWTEIHV